MRWAVGTAHRYQVYTTIANRKLPDGRMSRRNVRLMPEIQFRGADNMPLALVSGFSWTPMGSVLQSIGAILRPLIEAVCVQKGYKAPIVCTPEELRKEKP